jgi:hypothetical protein
MLGDPRLDVVDSTVTRDGVRVPRLDLQDRTTPVCIEKPVARLSTPPTLAEQPGAVYEVGQAKTRRHLARTLLHDAAVPVIDHTSMMAGTCGSIRGFGRDGRHGSADLVTHSI